MLRFVDEKISQHLGIQNRMAIAKSLNNWRFKEHFEKRKIALTGRIYKTYVENCSPLNEEDGYGYLPQIEKELIVKLVENSSAIIDEDKSKTSSKGFMVNHLENHHLREHSSFLDVALNPNIIRSAAEYLGCVPILSSIKVLVSSADDGTAGALKSSKLFHLDQPDRPLFKVIVNLNKIDEDTGPFTFIKKSASLKAQSRLKSGWNRRSDLVLDKDIFDLVSANDVIKLTGEIGDAYFVDSSQCFHFGSRNQKRERRLLMMTYLSPCRADFRDPFNFHQFRPSCSTLEKWILDPFALP